MRKGRVTGVESLQGEGISSIMITDSDNGIKQEVHCKKETTRAAILAAYGPGVVENLILNKEIFWQTDGQVLAGFVPVEQASEEIKWLYREARDRRGL